MLGVVSVLCPTVQGEKGQRWSEVSSSALFPDLQEESWGNDGWSACLVFPARASETPSVSQRVDDREAHSGPAPFPSDQESGGEAPTQGHYKLVSFLLSFCTWGRKVGSIPPTPGAGR